MHIPDIILLNGPSSAGKSTLGRELQALYEGEACYLFYSVDFFLLMCPERMQTDKDYWLQEEKKIIEGFHRAVAGYLAAGNRIILDHVLLKKEWVESFDHLFTPESVLRVGLTCPLEILKQREKERKDRPHGMAETQHKIVHEHIKYDLLIDTSILTPHEAALKIKGSSSEDPLLKRI
jgi:chloramphenicol 3-O phosphotransferase